MKTDLDLQEFVDKYNKLREAFMDVVYGVENSTVDVNAAMLKHKELIDAFKVEDKEALVDILKTEEPNEL